MKKKLLAMLLAVALAFSLLPGTALADGPEETDLPDWYFLFAIFKSVDADCADGKGTTTHTTYTMTQDEVDVARTHASLFEEYMNSLGVMRAHVDVVEIDTPVTELILNESGSGSGSYIGSAQAAPLLEAEGFNLDKYDHVTCVVSLNMSTGYLGITGSAFENGTGQSCINLINREYAVGYFTFEFKESRYVHEFLHFMERMSKKWGEEFHLHDLRYGIYDSDNDKGEACYTDIILNRAKGDEETGTGVSPVAWQYPPHVLRTMSKLAIPEGVTSIGNSAFLGYTALTEVAMANGVTSIGDYAFYGCGNLESVTIPNSVTSIGRDAFYGCTSLENVTIPSGVTSVDDWTFGYCSSLKNVTIPSSVTSIGLYALYGCSNLNDIYYGGTEEQWNEISIGDNNTALTRASTTIHYNCASGAAGDGVEWSLVDGVLTLSGVGSMKNYNHPNATSSLTPWLGLQELIHTVRIEAGVTGIGSYAFSGCDNLKNVTIPNTVTDIGYAAFYQCGALERVIIPDSVTRLGEWAFGYCSGLTSVIIPDSVTVIEGAAFYDCAGLRSVAIPASVTGINDFAFRGCANLGDIYYSGSEEQWSQISIGGSNTALSKAAVSYNRTAFSDIPTDKWYSGAVSWAVGSGITIGTGDATFSPEDTCKHIEILTFLWRAAGRPSAAQAPITMSVPDYQGAVNWACEKEMIGDGFTPDAPCSRADAVMYIWQAFGSETEDVQTSSFNDMSGWEAYAAAVDWAVTNGVVAGYGDNTFDPVRTCERAHIVAFLHRAYVPAFRVN